MVFARMRETCRNPPFTEGRISPGAGGANRNGYGS